MGSGGGCYLGRCWFLAWWWQSNIWYINARLWTGCYSHVITSWAPGEASILNPIWCTRMCAAAVKYFEQSNACSNLMRWKLLMKKTHEIHTYTSHITALNEYWMCKKHCVMGGLKLEECRKPPGSHACCVVRIAHLAIRRVAVVRCYGDASKGHM